MLKRFMGTVAAVAVLFGVTTSAQAADKTVKIGWTAWSDAEFVAKLSKNVLEKMGQNVELVKTGIAPQYQGVAQGDIDAMIMSWQPATHADYIEKFGDKIQNLGMLYDHSQLGWAVPEYMSKDKLNSIKDLKKDSVHDMLDGKIVGIDPGAGLSRLSKKTVKKYGLDNYDLQLSSGSGMTAALAKAQKSEDPIVVTAWTPHWLFGKWDMRFLKDPKGTLGSYEHIDAVAREDFPTDNVEAATALSRLYIAIDDLQAAMYKARESSYEKAVSDYMDDHQNQVNYWMTGKISEGNM